MGRYPVSLGLRIVEDCGDVPIGVRLRMPEFGVEVPHVAVVCELAGWGAGRFPLVCPNDLPSGGLQPQRKPPTPAKSRSHAAWAHVPWSIWRVRTRLLHCSLKAGDYIISAASDMIKGRRWRPNGSL